MAAHQQVVDGLAGLAGRARRLGSGVALAAGRRTGPRVLDADRSGAGDRGRPDRAGPAERTGHHDRGPYRRRAGRPARASADSPAAGRSPRPRSPTSRPSPPPSRRRCRPSLREAAVLDPQRSAELAALAGSSAPAGLGIGVAAAVGGQSPLDPPASPGLYAAVRQADAHPPRRIRAGGRYRRRRADHHVHQCDADRLRPIRSAGTASRRCRSSPPSGSTRTCRSGCCGRGLWIRWPRGVADQETYDPTTVTTTF